MNIEWQEGAVCFAGSSQWFASCKDNQLTSKCGSYGGSLDECIGSYNFQLNTIKQGDYITKSEIEMESRSIRAAEVFGLFGFNQKNKFEIRNPSNTRFIADLDFTFCGTDSRHKDCKRKITFNQLMAIGELKRLLNKRVMDERGYVAYSTDNKSQQAYEILESLDYEFDSGKERWYRKEWVRC